MLEFYHFFCYDYCAVCDINMKSFAHDHIYAINFKKKLSSIYIDSLCTFYNSIDFS